MPKILPFRKPDPHILIVEDDDNTLDVFVDFIRTRITPRVHGVMNAWSAIEYLNTRRPIDLVVTDINLGFGRTDVKGMNGIELTRIIKRNWNIPIIVMTGYKPERLKPVALEAGASLFLAKPFNLGVLNAAINHVLPSSARRTDTAMPRSQNR